MTNCKKYIKKVNCKKPNKSDCDNSCMYFNNDITWNKKKSSLNYSNQPSNCPPKSHCLNKGISGLPNIPNLTYNMFSSPKYNGYCSNELYCHNYVNINYN